MDSVVIYSGCFMCILIAPFSHSHPRARKLNNHTTKPHATTVGRRFLWVFFGVGGLFEERKKKSLIRVWVVFRAVSQAWNLSWCACVYLREEEAEYVARVATVPSFRDPQLKRAESKTGATGSNATCVTQAHTQVTVAFFTHSQLFA